MAAESSTAASGGRSGVGGGASADSYIGSLISLTSKSEIRYEGVLYNINTDESSIGLRNVRSFGTEGRKMDGPQVPPSEKIYEYILFRGSDIKDLQVKASPPAPPPQVAPSINSDPAIIQSHYPRATAPPATLPAAPSAPLPELGSHSSQVGLQGSTFQSGLPLYQPGGNMNSWGPSPPNPNGSGLAMPSMYWPGFYGAPNGLPQLPQQPLLRPPHGLAMPPMQQMQFPGYNPSLPTGANLPNSNLPDYHSLAPNSTSSSNLTSSSLPASSFPLNVPPLQPVSIPSETMFSSLQNKAPISAVPTSAPSSNMPSLASLSMSVPNNAQVPSATSKPISFAGPSALTPQASQSASSVIGSSSSILTEAPTPSLVTPGQLLQSGPAAVPASQPVQTTQKDVEVVQVSAKPSQELSVPVATEAQPPILPLPPNTRAHKPNGGAYHMRNNYRGRGGRGPGISRPVAKFTEDFDFTAMNEKFKKDEVWGHLGKSNKSHKDDENGGSEDEDLQDEYDNEVPKIEVKSVYKKDDFFDSLSCNSFDNDPNHGRPRYSEQMKLDTETFGDFSRFRGGRGGMRGGRGGGRFRGSYSGRGYGGGGGYGYGGRGRGRGPQNRTS